MTISRNKKDWFRLKKYPHIGVPLGAKDRPWVETYVKDPEKIAKHAFFPFIHRKLGVRKFRRETCHDGTRSVLRKPAEKIREIYFANHLDSNIYGYYASEIAKKYETQLENLGLGNSVTAYRRIRLIPSDPFSRNKCNIDFANDVFSYIKGSKSNSLIAITFDIKSFFDNLDHAYLKRQWRKTIGSGNSLPEDHYNVFRNITKFSYIEENDIFNEFKNEILVERKPHLTKKKVDKKAFLRRKQAVAFCKKSDIERIRLKNYIRSNKVVFDFVNNQELRTRDFGIPQGSPISALLANVYLLDFDLDVNNFLNSIGGRYQRYSDDMVAICECKDYLTVIDLFRKKIKECKLEIQQSKTQVFRFARESPSDRFGCEEMNLNTNRWHSNTNFEYLGFQFDGYFTSLKNASVASYYRKMKKAIYRAKLHSKRSKVGTKGEIFKSRLYKKFTVLGSQRRRIYVRDSKISNKFVLSHKYDWGNYLTYARLAARIIPDNKIEGQMKKHWSIFHSLLPKKKKPKV